MCLILTNSSRVSHLCQREKRAHFLFLHVRMCVYVCLGVCALRVYSCLCMYIYVRYMYICMCSGVHRSEWDTGHALLYHFLLQSLETGSLTETGTSLGASTP